jgi:hypothetical protein
MLYSVLPSGESVNIVHYENFYHLLRSCYKGVSTNTFRSAPIDM